MRCASDLIFNSLLFLLSIALLCIAPDSVKAADDMTTTIVVGGSRIDVAIENGPLKVTQQDLVQWVQRAAEAVTTYYGRYPRPHVLIRVLPSGGRGVHGAQTFGRDGGFIRIRVGADASAAELMDDWTMTHEMVHLAFPSMADEHHWIEEGLATYVEPIARIQAGQMKAERMWADLVRDMPKGEPDDGDKGLDRTHTWGRTYWGGALFCFVADVQFREKTGNKRGLQDAMRAILSAGGDITQDWEITRALKIGDDAVGASVLVPLYESWKDAAVSMDLQKMWKQLGVGTDGNGAAAFDDKAPLAQVRQAITATRGEAKVVSTVVGRSAAQ
jgi:hypothetical protein